MGQKYIIQQDSKYQDNDWWSWWIWIEGTNDDLDKISSVTYILHSTFKNPVQKTSDRSTKFMLKTGGWGTFTFYANILLKDGKEVKLSHDLKLFYPSGEENVE